MVQQFEQNVCAVVRLNDDGKLVLPLCAANTSGLCSALGSSPAEHFQDIKASLVFCRGEQSCQSRTNQEDQQDWPHQIASPEPQAAAEDPAEKDACTSEITVKYTLPAFHLVMQVTCPD